MKTSGKSILALAATSLAAMGGSAAAYTLNVTVANDTPPGGFSVTPVYTAIHDGGFDAFDAGEAASPGVERLAELGDVSGLPPERLAVDPGSTATVVAAAGNGIPPIEPGETGTATLNVGDPTEQRFLTYLSMLVPSNDTFLGNDDPMAYEIFAPDGSFNGALTIRVMGSDSVGRRHRAERPCRRSGLRPGRGRDARHARGRRRRPRRVPGGLRRDRRGQRHRPRGGSDRLRVRPRRVPARHHHRRAGPAAGGGAAPGGGPGPPGRLAAGAATGLTRGALRRRVRFAPAAPMAGSLRTRRPYVRGDSNRQGRPMQLTGKTAVVTGSNSGIGLGIARELARAGASVVLNSYTDAEEDHALARSVAEEFGVEARYVQADLADGDAARRLVEAAGACDVLVNNAGIQHVAPIPDFPAARWDAVLAINLSSAFHTTAAALPMMREAGWGRVVNIASAHGLTASPYKSAYVAAKHGLVGLTKVTALETAEEPITANAICPGYVLTPLVEEQIPDTMKEYGMDRETVIREVMLARQPSKAFATVEQMGGTAVFLCSPAADQITGTTISVDGGWTAL